MGMIGNLVQVSPAELAELLTGRLDVHAFLYDEDGEPQGETLDLDKAWHGIHFLLTGSDWGGSEPLCFLLAGGEGIGESEVGYGPARALTPADVLLWDAALQEIDLEGFRQRFDPPLMLAAEIYPAIWDRDPAEDDTLGYLADYYADLRRFVHDTARAQLGLVVYLS